MESHKPSGLQSIALSPVSAESELTTYNYRATVATAVVTSLTTFNRGVLFGA